MRSGARRFARAEVCARGGVVLGTSLRGTAIAGAGRRAALLCTRRSYVRRRGVVAAVQREWSGERSGG